MTEKASPIAWPRAFQALEGQWNTTPGEVAIWIWNYDLRAYWYGGDPNGPLVRFSFLEDARGDDYRSSLATLFFKTAEIDAFTPHTRYLTYEQLSERWRRHFESDKALKEFVIAATGADTGNLSVYVPPLDPLDRRDRPIEECLFDDTKVKRRTEVYFGSEPRIGANGRIETEASFEICLKRYEKEVGGPGQHRVHALNRAQELTVPAVLEVLKRDLGGDYPDNLELLATLFHEHRLDIRIQGIAPLGNYVTSALYSAMTLGFTPKTEPSTGESAEIPCVARLLDSGKLLERPLHVCTIRRDSMRDTLLSHGGVAGLASWPGLESVDATDSSAKKTTTDRSRPISPEPDDFEKPGDPTSRDGVNKTVSALELEADEPANSSVETLEIGSSHRKSDEDDGVPGFVIDAADLEWKDVSIVFVEDDRVSVTVKKLRKRLNYAEMGFKDNRAGCANKLWVVLREVLAHPDRTTKDEYRETMKDDIKRLRSTLKAFFRIDDDPFHDYRKMKMNRWVPRFKITDDREFSDGKSDRETYTFEHEGDATNEWIRTHDHEN